MAKNFGINLPYVKMSSAQTAAFPSGHSAQAFLIKEVLTDMYPEMNPLFVKAADNISHAFQGSTQRLGLRIENPVGFVNA